MGKDGTVTISIERFKELEEKEHLVDKYVNEHTLFINKQYSKCLQFSGGDSFQELTNKANNILLDEYEKMEKMYLVYKEKWNELRTLSLWGMVKKKFSIIKDGNSW